ncbi:MAG: hypothetical protein WAL38_38575 [Solirubrobacteraceae bacterium]
MQNASVQQLVNALKSKGLATQMPIDAWIDPSNLVRRIQLAFSDPLPNTGQTISVAMTENFLEYGPQPVPAVPSASQSNEPSVADPRLVLSEPYAHTGVVCSDRHRYIDATVR